MFPASTSAERPPTVFSEAVEPARLVDELMGVARKLGIEVRVVPLRGPTRSAGGLCRLNGKQMLLLDQKSSAIDRAGALAEALAGLDDLENVFMAPEARELVHVARVRALRLASGPTRPSSMPPSPIRTLVRAKPGVRAAKPRARAGSRG